MTGRVRPAAVAGMFYPERHDILERDLDRYLAAAEQRHPTAVEQHIPKAIIAPHAGYMYSGPIAASVYARLAGARGTVDRVVLLGPAHRVYVEGIAASSADEFETPLGLVPVDIEAREQILGLPHVAVHDDAHALEHSLEVHLPFLQRILGEFRLLPLVVGEAQPDEVAAVLDTVWGGPETLIVVSTDLSHYHDYRTATEIDARTAAAIVACRPGDIDPYAACGAYPLRGLLVAAERRSLPIELIDLRNSGDTAGDRQRVVGYGSFVVG